MHYDVICIVRSLAVAPRPSIFELPDLLGMSTWPHFGHCPSLLTHFAALPPWFSQCWRTVHLRLISLAASCFHFSLGVMRATPMHWCRLRSCFSGACPRIRRHRPLWCYASVEGYFTYTFWTQFSFAQSLRTRSTCYDIMSFSAIFLWYRRHICTM